jgi:hypothetical protein
VEARRLGPVVGLGTWNTIDGDAALAHEVVGAAFAAYSSRAKLVTALESDPLSCYPMSIPRLGMLCPSSCGYRSRERIPRPMGLQDLA